MCERINNFVLGSCVARALEGRIGADVASVDLRSGPVMDDGSVYGMRSSALAMGNGACDACDFFADVAIE